MYDIIEASIHLHTYLYLFYSRDGTYIYTYVSINQKGEPVVENKIHEYSFFIRLHSVIPWRILSSQLKSTLIHHERTFILHTLLKILCKQFTLAISHSALLYEYQKDKYNKISLTLQACLNCIFYKWRDLSFNMNMYVPNWSFYSSETYSFIINGLTRSNIKL